MDDEGKSHEELIREIRELRGRLSDLKAKDENSISHTSAPDNAGFEEPPGFEPPDDRAHSLRYLSAGETPTTETIDLSSLFTRDLTASGSFDIRGNIWATTFGKVMRALPIPALLTDESQKIAVVNEACGKVSRDYEKIVGSTFSILFPSPSAGLKAESILALVSADRRPRTAEARLKIGQNGMWGRLTFRSIRIFQERFILVLIEDLTREKTQLVLNKNQREALHREIEQRKLSEAALRESEQFLSNVFAGIQDGISVQDTELRIVRVNPTLERWFADVMPLVGKKCFEAYHDQEVPCTICPSQQTLRTGRPSHAVVSKKGPGGEIVAWIELHSFPMVDQATGAIKGVIEYARDITERKRAEDELRLLEKRNRLLIEASPIGIGIIQHDRLVYANPALTKIFGIENLGESIGRPAEQFVVPEDRQDVRQRRADRLAGKPVPVSYELRGLKENGERVDVMVWPKETDYLGRPSVLFFAVDTSESKALRAQLLHTQKMEAMGTLAGGIAHEFNNLLTVASGYTELLLADKEEGGPDYSDLQKIAASCARGAELVRKLRLLGKRAESEFQPLNLNRELNETVELLSPRLPVNVTVDLRLDDSLQEIRGDSSQVAQIIINLMLNAADAMPEGGKLSIETKNCTLDEEYCRAHLGAKAGDYVQLTVSDTGHGMDDETLSRIFEPFFTTRGLANRSGLGLAMIHGIIEEHGGYIACESKAGLGSIFRVYLPATPGPRRSAPVTDKVEIQGGTETVLLVEDEELVMNLLSEILRRVGYQVLTATNGREALDLYGKERQSISLVILDLIMPQMGGKECLAQLLKIDPQLKTIIATGYSDEANRDELIEAGAKGFVSKPLEMAQFLRTVREVLDRD